MEKEDLKVGDRVVVNGYDIWQVKDGCKGTVKQLNNFDAAIDFDDDVGGWEDCRLGIMQGHGVYVPYECLSLPESEVKSKVIIDVHQLANDIDLFDLARLTKEFAYKVKELEEQLEEKDRRITELEEQLNSCGGGTIKEKAHKG